MKTLSLTVSALTVLAGTVIVSDAAKAQAWMDIARQPVPSFSASRGYTGDHSYFGPEMYTPGNLGNPIARGGRGGAGGGGTAFAGGRGDGGGNGELHEIVEDLLGEDCE
jgi:hypothetical protein